MKTRLLFVLALMLLMAGAIQAQTLKEVDSKKVYNMLQKDESLVVLDVRSPEEFNDGHVEGAINIDIRRADAFSRINKLDRNATYVVYCRTGNRSKVAVDHMMRSGFNIIYHMTDGIIGWNANKLPIE